MTQSAALQWEASMQRRALIMLLFLGKNEREEALQRKILKRTVRKATARKASPVYQRFRVNRKTIAAMTACRDEHPDQANDKELIAIPMITRAMNPKEEAISTEVTARSSLLARKMFSFSKAGPFSPPGKNLHRLRFFPCVPLPGRKH